MTRARELGKLANKNSLTADNTNNFVGIGSTQPDSRLDVLGGAQISGITTFSSRVDVGAAITIGAASGIVSATAFYGDGSNLEGVASAGLGTALAETQPGNVIYYTDNVLGIGSTVVVDPPTSTNVAYTQYAEISVDENVDFIVAEGDDFVPDILGISTVGIATLTGIGGRIRAGTFTNKAGTGAPQLTFGAEIPVGYGLTGAGGINVGGAATISGNLTVGGVLTYDDVTNVDSLGIITARSNVSIADSIIHTGDTDTSIRFPSAGTFTVSTNGSEAIRVDSSQRFFVNQTSNVGSTAKLEVTGTLLNTNPEYSYPIMSVDDAAYDSSSGPGGGIGFAFKYTNGGAYAQAGGIRGFKENTTDNNYDASMAFYTRANGSAPTEKLRITSTGGVHFSNAELIERVNIVANKLSAVPNVSLDNGMVHYYTTNETTTATPNIISTAGINTSMATGDTMSVTIMSKPNNAGYFPKVSIDGVATGITTYWSGGSAPSSAESSGVDVNVYQIIKTANATYDVIANTSNFA
jgi:hypothetical protein